MTGTYLVSSFADKDRVKALGARWDPSKRQWYVPEGRELAPFAQWLPTGIEQPSSTDLVLPAVSAPNELVVPTKRGVPLSQLLHGVASAVSQTFKVGVWTFIDVVDTRMRNGHIYLEVSERDASGVVTAKANAVIWASTALQILPAFETATGAQLGPGIKLLVRARPVFKAQFGFSIELDAIDPDYTLGDLEARKRELRERLQREGLFHLNRNLPNPWDYNLVLVVAPEGGAGLGDFQAEARRLQDLDICRFVYVHSSFQGEGAATEIRAKTLEAISQLQANSARPDAIAVIRGGGAINDMAWLNDYLLVRTVCEIDIPVLTGIGHERDNTVVDEVANIRYDTPSKVIAGIERVIIQRVQEAKLHHSELIQGAERAVTLMQRAAIDLYTTIESGARHEIAMSRQRTAEMESRVQLDASHTLRAASEQTERHMAEMRRFAAAQLSNARSMVPSLMADIRAEARQTLQAARASAHAEESFVVERTSSDLRLMRDAADRSFGDVSSQSAKAVADAKTGSQTLMREIAGQGPEKTLSRGFALVRDAQGQPITTSSNTETEVTIQFRDGTRQARLQKEIQE